jgi:AraC-like DNA-binding protein
MDNRLFILAPEETLEALQDFYFPPYITLAHMFHAPDGWSLKQRVLKQYQLQYVQEGEAEYVIEEQVYRTRKGDLLLHGPEEKHHVRTFPGTPYVCLSIVFHFGHTLGAERSEGGRSHYQGNFADNPLEKQLSELIHHYRQPGFLHQQQSQQLLMSILLALGARKHWPEQATQSKEAAGTAKLILLRNYIDRHLQEGFRLADLERLSGWSRNYIILQFKRYFGMSPTQYLVWSRLEKAKELALQSGLSFGEIARQVGYSDIHSFGKIFKRKMGMSLSQFVDTLYMDTPDRE